MADTVIKKVPTTGTPTPLKCPDRLASIVESEGFICIEIYREHGQTCYVFERDPWDSQIVIRQGEYNDRFQDYCQTGNTESW